MNGLNPIINDCCAYETGDLVWTTNWKGEILSCIVLTRDKHATYIECEVLFGDCTTTWVLEDLLFSSYDEADSYRRSIRYIPNNYNECQNQNQ